MANTTSKVMDCTAFEARLSDYLEHTVEKDIRKAMAAHALQCALPLVDERGQERHRRLPTGL
jgi:hypothetical protein